ncbi:hypothetical protein NS228_22235 [Methylobacterium indicum]|uniref:tetratricopeptide repeat protein n=1 Tax=Methylobacterium indicum TaxID=1775910 RepID=UPI0007346C64|nr:tetratricopeptide repeat protein [Methylobacterium indicum]KTS31781.1 hypothetical protein NS228_22235 [Methylobacterium indicum]KTS37456.1 hypothetical protein NS229_06960 [Methylobacterium indicum]KTS43643.1 hypothetical protein NS230_26565 [Methylobacterium indicum]
MGSTGRSRSAAALIALAGWTAGASAAAAAQLTAIQGSEQKNFGRIALTFDHGVKVTAKVVGGVLVVGFREPVTGQRERLASEMPAYVAQVRRDPDGSGLRVALQAPYKVNVLEAGERVFIDLMPEGWTGLPPSLPPDVLADLTRRAEELSARLRREAAARAPRPVPLRLEVANLPTLTRLTMRLPRQAEVGLTRSSGEIRLRVPGAYTIDASEARSGARPAVTALATETGTDAAGLTVTLAEGYTAEGYREEESYVLDLIKPADKAKAQDAKSQDAKAQDAKASDAKASEAKVAESRSAEVKPAAPPPAARAEAGPDSSAPPPLDPAASTLPVQGRIVRGWPGLRIAFPFASRPPAALFERGGVATLVFETTTPVGLPALAAGAPASVDEAPRVDGAFTVMRLRLESGTLAQLAPGEGQGWDLVLGDGSAPSGDLLAPQRSADSSGKPGVSVPLARPGGALWLERDGERIAVVTARGPRIAGVPKRGRFVEFEVLPSRQGVAVLAAADDLAVRPGLAEVTITRPGGLSVSPAVVEAPEAGPKAASTLMVQPARWDEDQRGDVRTRIRAAEAAAASAERPARSAARVELARVLLANGFSAEASGVLNYATREDPALASQPPVRLLSAIAALRMGQDARAAGFLNPDGRQAIDPEMRLWRGYLDARARRSAPALSAFKAALPVIEAYPDDLQLPLYLAGAEAALEVKDPAFAQRALTAATPLAEAPLPRDRLAFLKARFAEAIGQEGEARRAYQQLSETGVPQVAAEATLRLVDLGRATGTMTPEAAIDRLERLTLIWHGDTEAEALARLGRLYAGAGRWRDAFATARKANRLYPDHPATRSLHDDTVALFSALFLSDKGASLGRIEALALFYDFKEFTPVGRQGDEIVRRLADRLVALDLLDAAGDLLQHQVDNRLTGAARASVAARLATVRLMEGEPLKALKVIQNTRLPELPAPIRDARLLLEARALSDLSRTDLALELLDGNSTPEAAHLRGDILWGARRWREAGEAHETLLGTRWRDPGPLSDAERNDVMRAAISYALAEDTLSLDRLRTKYTPKMADSPDARTFGLVAAPNASATAAFRSLVRQATSAETLTEFLRAYRARYPESAAPERPKPGPDGAPAGTGPEARGAGGPAPG